MTPPKNLPKEILEEFDKRFPKPTSSESGYDFEKATVQARSSYVVTSARPELKSSLLSTLTRLSEERRKEIERKLSNYAYHICAFNDAPQKCPCFAEALSDVISLEQERLKQIKTL